MCSDYSSALQNPPWPGLASSRQARPIAASLRRTRGGRCVWALRGTGAPPPFARTVWHELVGNSFPPGMSGRHADHGRGVPLAPLQSLCLGLAKHIDSGRDRREAAFPKTSARSWALRGPARGVFRPATQQVIGLTTGNPAVGRGRRSGPPDEAALSPHNGKARLKKLRSSLAT